MHTALRSMIFKPYRKGAGPVFTLQTWATDRTDSRGQTYISYCLSESMGNGVGRVFLFEGSDFAGSPLHADDSDETMLSLMTFLTLRPGDTDAEYFADYTPRQMAFVAQHAEALSCEVMNRLGGE
jgi:hypothetical protein